MVFDCFPFFNELELLEVRLTELDSVVDYFVLAEATRTHAGEPKPLYFDDNRQHFSRWLPRILHVVVDDMPDGHNAWPREMHQRDAVMRALVDCAPDDVVISCDADEIARASVIDAYYPSVGMSRLQMDHHFYYMNYRGPLPWHHPRIGPYRAFQTTTPSAARNNSSYPTIGAAGWHWSYLGGVDRIVDKMKSFAHQEYNTPAMLDRDRITKAIAAGEDLYGRQALGGYRQVLVDGSFPDFVNRNFQRLVSQELIAA